MSHKTQFLGPLASGLDTGAPATTTKSFGRFTTWTPVTQLPFPDTVIAVLPGDAILSEINVWKTGSFVGEVDFYFGTGPQLSNNIDRVTVTAANRIYRGYVNSATAQTVLPYGHAKTSASPTPIYFSTSSVSGTASALAIPVLAWLIALTWLRR